MFVVIIAILVLAFGFLASALIEVEDRGKRLIRTVAIAGALFLLVASCFTYVPTGYTGIVTTFGKVHDTTLDAGISFKASWDNVVRIPSQVNILERSVELSTRLDDYEPYQNGR